MIGLLDAWTIDQRLQCMTPLIAADLRSSPHRGLEKVLKNL